MPTDHDGGTDAKHAVGREVMEYSENHTYLFKA